MRLRLWAAGVMGALAAGGSAAAAVSVIGGGMAQDCSKAAIAGKSDPGSILICSTALETEDLDRIDRAGTFVNRGVMKLRRLAFEEARTDLDAAIALAPTIGEAWVNMGAVFLGEERFQSALDDVDRGLRLGVKEPEKAWFNRGLAHEGLEDEKAAYFDYQRAMALKPDWPLPRKELLRFTVSRR
ncbi:MAG: tetratricopeptide repeat protein [Caulobacteraceae bacterium]